MQTAVVQTYKTVCNKS